MLCTSNHRLVGSDDFFFQLTCHMVHIDNGPLWTGVMLRIIVVDLNKK